MSQEMNIYIDESIWSPIFEDFPENLQVWHDGNGIKLALYGTSFDGPLYECLANERAVREHCRDTFAAQGFGIVECDLIDINGQKCVKVIVKKVQQHESPVYVGSLSIPMSDRSFVLSLHSQEVETSGIREAVILDMLINEGLDPIFDPDTGKINGWATDPYFPDYKGPSLRNLSESKKYDAQFPDHPLSKIRHRINGLIKYTLIMTVPLSNKKAWWKIW